MNKKELIYFIISFLKETLESEKNNYEEDYFFDQEEYDDFIDSIVCNLRGKLTKNNIENEWDGGADKEVIIFKDFDFVIKIPNILISIYKLDDVNKKYILKTIKALIKSCLTNLNLLIPKD